MKYHYQKGITEKDKTGHFKMKFLVLALIVTGAYGVFSYLVLNLNGVPLLAIDTSAKLVKSSKPGSRGDTLFIPSINLSVQVNNALSVSGNPATEDTTIKGKVLSFGLTPYELRNNSPFYNLSQLKDGDEIFLDKDNTRFAYRVTNKKDEDRILTLKSDSKTIVATPIGTVAWKNGSSHLESL